SAALELIRGTVEEVVAERGGGKLSLGLLAALWASSSGVAALIRGLNTAFDVTETRPWWYQRLAALGFTLLFGLQVAVGLTGIFYGETIGAWLAGKLDLGDYFPLVWAVTSSLALVLFVVVTFDLLYNLAPYVDGYAWRWASPGAVFGVSIWLAASFGFRLYLDHFDSYGRTYGSLGTVIVLLLWFHLTGAALLFGAEVNSEILKAERDSLEG
ncbi:MAG: YihY/virulence factor BrkB family protein, partial [Acidobacteria bacterium]|nr:YihY/virulence factor BrkB family protein [Acidobacteriota bacterium]